MLLLGIAGITLLVVWLLGMAIYRISTSRSTQRRVSREISESAIEKIVDRFTKFVASKKSDDKAMAEQFYVGQRLRFHSENDGAGPLIWGTVLEPKFRGLRVLLMGDDGREYRRKYSILGRLNFPKQEPVFDQEVAAMINNLERAAGYGAVNPSTNEVDVLTAN